MLELSREVVPQFPDLKPLGPEDRELLAGSIRESGTAVCDLALANLYIWRDCELPSLTRIGKSLCIRMEPHSSAPYFLQPLGGTGWIGVVRTCLAHTGLVSRAGVELASILPRDEFDIRPMRDHSDYIFSVQALAQLKGKKFDGKRNQVRKFVGSFPEYSFRMLEAEALPRAIALFDCWTAARGTGSTTSDPSHPGGYGCQRQALERAFQAFSSLSLRGGAIVVRGETKAFVIASQGAPGTAVVHFAYADTQLPGIYQALLWETCRNLLTDYVYVNLEEDLGVPGLRKTKLSYQPLRLEEKFEVRSY